MPRVKKWIWKLVETDEYVDVLDRIPPIGEPKKTYSLPVLGTAVADSTPLPDGTHEVVVALPPDPLALGPAPPLTGTITAHSVDHSTFPPTEKMTIQFDQAWVGQPPQPFKPRAGEPPEFAALDHPYVGGKFTLFVLGYGDHLDLVQRCLTSILNTCPRHRFDLRVALNQPSGRVEEYVGGLRDAGVVTRVYTDHGDRRKYPAMRTMFWDDSCKIETPYVCWFDDDSWCRRADWMVLLARAIVKNHPHQGRLYGAWHYHDLMGVTRPGAAREAWFKAAPWWRGRPLFSGNGRRLAPNGSQIVFASGGFWALATHVIREQDIPDVRLRHNGGDVTLGAQVTQGGYKVVDFSPKPGKEVIAWSDAPRRGFQEKFPWA